MKNTLKLILITFLILIANGCGRSSDTREQLKDILTDQASEINTTPSISADLYDSITDASEESVVGQTENTFTDNSFFNAADEDGIVSDYCDTLDITLSFTNFDSFYSNDVLPMYAFNILRDSTMAYLIQLNFRDVTELEYINDTLETTNETVSFACHISGHPEYDLYLCYYLEAAYFDYALIILE